MMLYFPIIPRLRKLLKVPRYHAMLQHEFVRPTNNRFMTDIYDSEDWQKFMGPPTYPNDRIGAQFCNDTFPANAEGSISITPGVCMNMSLPPTERAKPANMMLIFVMPSSIKGEAQRKYFNFMARFELNELFHRGVDGVKFKIYSTSLDTPGRAELMGTFLLLYS